MNQLSTMNHVDIAKAINPKLWAYVPVITQHGIGLGAAIANERGYMPVNLCHFRADTFADAQAEAERLNFNKLGLSKDFADQIIFTTLNRGQESA